jgi:malonate-semialdehyde dehydrogenase (acetylating)/methylmalonate-semialdehyde dehydrogenase
MRKKDHVRAISHFINGQQTTGTGTVTSPVYNPTTGQVQAILENGDPAIVADAVVVAQAAQRAWAAVNPQIRARTMFMFKGLIEEHKQELVHLMSSEHGKR